MSNTALRFRAVREKRRNDPYIREKVERVVDTCDEALEEAAELVKAAAAILSKYPVIEDVTYQCSLQDIQQISESLSRIVECRKALDKDRYIGRLATGRLGAEIDHLGDAFAP